MLEKTLILAQLVITAGFTGLLWMVQVVHYPTFFWVTGNFEGFARFHAMRISFLVIPLMCGDLITSFIWVTYSHTILPASNLVLSILIWILTLFWAMPCHESLQQQFEAKIVQRLLKINGLRTFLATIKLTLLSLAAIN